MKRPWLLILIPFVIGADEIPTSIQCQFVKKASVSVTLSNDDKLNFESNCDSAKMGFTIGNLDTESPVLVGNAGTSQLVRLQLTPDSSTLYLAESTPTGNINIITIFLKSQMILFAKQYEMVYAPYGLMMIGVWKPVN